MRFVPPTLILALPVAFFLTACGSLSKPELGAKPRVQPVTLSSAQQKVVSDGVREMVAKVTVSGGEGATLSGLKAFSLPQGTGVHVCGDVSYKAEPGKPAKSAPYYLELETARKPVAKRGQVASDKLKKSKVTFMCRHVNGG